CGSIERLESGCSCRSSARGIQDHPVSLIQSDAPTRQEVWDRSQQCSSGLRPTGGYVPAWAFLQRFRLSPWQWFFVKAHTPVGFSIHLRILTRGLRWRPQAADFVRQGVATCRIIFVEVTSHHFPCRHKYISICI